MTKLSIHGKSCMLVMTKGAFCGHVVVCCVAMVCVMQFPLLNSRIPYCPDQPPAHMLLPEGEGPETNNQFGLAYFNEPMLVKG